MRNTADEPVLLQEYAVLILLFETDEPTGLDGDGMIDRTPTTREFEYSEDEPTPPGETVTLRYTASRPMGSEVQIQSYEIYIDCDQMSDDLPCEGGI